MVKNVGKIIFLQQKRMLEYYVFGNEHEGYGIRIVQKGKENAVEEQAHITASCESAVDLARSLAKGTVFPQHLHNVLEDCKNVF